MFDGQPEPTHMTCPADESRTHHMRPGCEKGKSGRTMICRDCGQSIAQIKQNPTPIHPALLALEKH